jgi:flagellar biosynthesis GTPase FlhF
MAGRIFISYRREDSRADARSIYQRLERVFGKTGLFMDVDTIQKGRDFTKVLDEHLAHSDVMLVIIGSHWLSIQDDEGTRRLDDPEDFVRTEIARALKRDIAVIPVLVDGARMPKAEELPDDLKPLSRRQASTVTHENFTSDVEGLAGDLKAMLKPKSRWRLMGVGALAAVLLLAIAGYQANSWLEAAREAAKQAALEAEQKAAEEEAAKQAALEAQQKAAEEEAAKQAALEAQQKAGEEAAKQAALEAQQKAAEEEAAKQAALEAQQKAAEEEAARRAQQKAAEEEAAKQATPRPAPGPTVAALPDQAFDDVPRIIVAPGDKQRFTVKMNSSAELTSNGIIIFVSQPDLARSSIGIRIAGGGTRMGVGQEFPLDVHGGGSCKLSLLKVTVDEAGFILRC